jgi:hypothetical protein
MVFEGSHFLMSVGYREQINKQTYDTTHGGSGTEHPVASALGMPQPGIILVTEHPVASALGTPQPGINCLSPLPELQCLTPSLTWVRQSGVKNGIPAWPDPNAARPTPMSSDGPYREAQASCLAPPVPSSRPAQHGPGGRHIVKLPATVHPG